MALEAIFTVTIGLLLIWIVFSLAINQIHDSITVNQSAKDLQVAIDTMLGDKDLVRKFYDRPVIRSLSYRRSERMPAWFYKYPILRVYFNARDNIPGVIPSSIFADAMFDVLVYDSLTPEEMKEDLSTARINTSLERLQSRKPHLSQTLSRLFPRLDRPSILDSKVVECKKNIENWYNYSTFYLASAQRRYEQNMALVLGFIAALILNIDLISVAIQLWQEPTVRQVIVQNAANFEVSQGLIESNPEEVLEDFRNQFTGLSLPIGWVINRTDGEALYDSNCKLFPSFDQAFGIPVVGSNLCISPPELTNQTNLILKIVNFLVTALAARQGAPFWSDVLKRLVSHVH